MDYEELEGEEGHGTLVKASRAGQLAWKDIIGRLKEFEYEHEGVVIRWHIAGAKPFAAKKFGGIFGGILFFCAYRTF